MTRKVAKFGSSRPLSRSEDSRLLSGNGTFIDNSAPPGALYAYFFRSPVAHASFSTLNVADAKKAPGVHLVLVAADLLDAGITEGLPFDVIDNRDGSKGAAPRRPLLAEGKVRFVGEPLAVIFADTLFQARDACELIGFDFDLLPAHTSPNPGGEALHTHVEDNCAFDWACGDEDVCEQAFQRSKYHVRKRIRNNRVIVNTIEPRGCYAEVSGSGLHIAVNGQGVKGTRDSIAHILGLPPEQVRVTTPDVGGGFGMKAMSYPEPFLVAHAARTLHRSVRWMSERIEAMLTDTGARDLTHDVEMAFDEDYKLAGYRVRTNCNLGAYNSDLGQCIQTTYFAMVLAGAYDVQSTFLNVKGIFTNSAPTDAYRGAGRAEAIYVLERMMDYAARELGVDPWHLRRRNFIQPNQFPYTSSTGEVYDASNFDLVLTRAAEQADLGGFESRKANSIAAGKLRGLGLSYYVMNAIGSSQVSTRLAFTGDGTVTLSVPSQSSGQGHESVFAVFLSDQTGIKPDKIRILQGDSDQVVLGGGTGGSSSATIVANATLVTVETAIEAFLPFLASQMQVEIDNLEFDGQTFRAPGSNLTPTLLEAAEMARAAERYDLLSHEGIGKINSWAFPNGAHVAEVEVDPETGRVTLERYTVVDDFGNLINPLLVEGQVHGGSTQGIGQALMENAVFDQDGQLLSASFMDYAMPRADDLPLFSFTSEPVPSTANVMGVKGCGEAGTVGAVSATANAVADALWRSSASVFDIPFTPCRVWEILSERR
jgi:carbon-monoxide dehydrogenase large subunit